MTNLKDDNPVEKSTYQIEDFAIDTTVDLELNE